MCTECVPAMSRAKDKLLIRIASANCQQAEQEQAVSREGSMYLIIPDPGRSNH